MRLTKNTAEDAPRTEKLLTCNFCCVAAANFFLFLSFYALMPLLPFYLAEQFAVDESVTGMILSVYMVACIVVRPFSGYLLDTFRRRPIYLAAYLLFALVFCGYVVATLLAWFVFFRMLHGLAFGMATVSGTTLVSQIIPRARLGEGLGIYGLANTLSMCIGPMLGLAAARHYSFTAIFTGITVLAFCGLLMAACVKIPPRGPVACRSLTRESLFIPSGMWIALVQTAVFVPYGATTAYIAVYAVEAGVPEYAGLYFTSMAVGLAVSRPLSGRSVDKGHVTGLTAAGLALAAVTGISLSVIPDVSASYRHVAFLAVALLQGLTYGILHPSFNTLFVKLAPESRRGAATSMFLTSNDLGIGIGILVGGVVARCCGGYFAVYRLGALLGFLAFLLFVLKARGHFLKHRMD